MPDIEAPYKFKPIKEDISFEELVDILEAAGMRLSEKAYKKLCWHASRHFKHE